MPKVIDLDVAFDNYFNQVEGFALRGERFLDDAAVANPSVMIEWLKAAYKAGAHTMARDTYATLLDYGTAVAGLDAEPMTPTESFDSSAENLKSYYVDLFEDF
jgi:hypothetical protein